MRGLSIACCFSIAYDVTAQYTEGWDWMTPIRDRNTGIWDKCYLHVSGPICLRDPHITTRLRPSESPSANREFRAGDSRYQSSHSMWNGNLEAVVTVRVTLDSAAQFASNDPGLAELQAHVVSLPQNGDDEHG